MLHLACHFESPPVLTNTGGNYAIGL